MINVFANIKSSPQFSEDGKKNRPHEDQNSIFLCQNGFIQKVHSIQRVRSLLL